MKVGGDSAALQLLCDSGGDPPAGASGCLVFGGVSWLDCWGGRVLEGTAWVSAGRGMVVWVGRSDGAWASDVLPAGCTPVGMLVVGGWVLGWWPICWCLARWRLVFWRLALCRLVRGDCSSAGVFLIVVPFVVGSSTSVSSVVESCKLMGILRF